jgi:hypothetical protein
MRNNVRARALRAAVSPSADVCKRLDVDVDDVIVTPEVAARAAMAAAVRDENSELTHETKRRRLWSAE